MDILSNIYPDRIISPTIDIHEGDMQDIIQYKWASVLGCPVDHIVSRAVSNTCLSDYRTLNVCYATFGGIIVKYDFSIIPALKYVFGLNDTEYHNFVLTYAILWYKLYSKIPDDIGKANEYIFKISPSYTNVLVSEINLPNWLAYIRDEMNNDREDLNELLDDRNKIHNMAQAEISNNQVDTAVLNWETVISADKLWTIFDRTVMSKDSPCVVFIGPEKFLVKTHRTVDRSISKQFVLGLDRFANGTNIYFFIVVDDKIIHGKISTKSVQFTLSQSKGDFNSIRPLVERSEHVIMTFFPEIKTVPHFIVKALSGNLVMSYDTPLHIPAFNLVAATLLTPGLNKYLYIDEESTPQAEKSSVNIHYGMSKSQGSLSLVQYVDKVYVNIIRVESKYVLDHFLYLVRRLVIKAITDTDLAAIFTVAVPGILDHYTQLKSIDAPEKEYARHIDRLRSETTGIFTKSYGTACSGEARQPHVIQSRDDANNQDIVDIFEPHLFVCKTAPYLYPTLLKNTDPDGMPYYPCCSNKKVDIGQQLEKFKEERVKKGTTLDVSSRVLAPDQKSTVSNSMSSILMRNDTNITGIARRGMDSTSMSSLLHAVFFGARSPDFKKEFAEYTSPGKTRADLDAIIIRIRSNLLKHVAVETMRQEMYDYDVDTMKSYLIDSNVFMDSRLVYRALELVFKVNIFVVGYNGDFELPRYARMYIKNHRPELPSVMVMRRDDVRKNVLQYPHYELVGWLTTESIMRRNFSGDFLHKLFMYNHQTLTWSSTGTDKVVTEGSTTKRFDTFSRINVENIAPGSIVSQHLDSLGKVQMLAVRTSFGLQTLFVPPVQPLNVPISQKIHKLDMRQVYTLVGGVSLITAKDVEGDVLRGLWVRIADLTEGIYIPVKPRTFSKHKVIVDLPLGSGQPAAFEPSDTSILLMNKRRDVLLFVLRYLVDIYRTENKSEESAIDVAGKFFKRIYRPSGILPTDVGDISMFPQDQSLEEALEYLSTKSSFFTRSKLRFSDERLLKKLVQYTIQYIKVNTIQLERVLIVPPSPSTMYLQDNVTILHSFEQWRMWLSTQPINLSFYMSLPNQVDEYSAYLIKGVNRDYLLQTFFEPTKKRAVQFALMYKEYKVNLGPNIPYPVGVDKIPENLTVIENKPDLILPNELVLVKDKDMYTVLIPIN